MRPKSKPCYTVFPPTKIDEWKSDYKNKALALRVAKKFGKGTIISFSYIKYKGKDCIGSEINARQYDHTGKKYWDRRINAQLIVLEEKRQNIEKRMRDKNRREM